MDSTATALEKLGGDAFERLCGPVLRKMIPELANFIPSGINASGRTIKSLTDGFCFIDSKHLATVHITTNASNLAKKWLYNGNAKTTIKGDLIKGIIQAREIYQTNPGFRFTIYLVYSRTVKDELHLKVHEENIENFINVRIIEQRDLVSFLDHDAEGQYMRRLFLGIDADRISQSLLREIGWANLLGYGQENYIKDANLLKVSGQQELEEHLIASKTTVNLLTGESGFGKTSMCFWKMQAVLESGGVSMRIKPSIIENAASLEDAIRQQLIYDYPKIYIHPSDIQIMFKNSLLVVDDINKFPKPVAVLDKLIAWNKTKTADTITIICPVWPFNLDALDNKAQKVHDFTVISIGRLSFYDCKAIIEQRTKGRLPSLTEQQIHSLIVETGFDPLLLDFSLEMLAGIDSYSERIPGEAIKRFVADKVRQIHNLYQSPVYLINQSLIMLGREMLKNRRLDPHLTDIEKWLDRGSEEYRIITLLAAQRQLFLIDDDGKCIFRHDRVRDYLLGLAVATLFADYAANEDVLADPYYSEITGAAMAVTAVQKPIVEWLIKSNPLAVYISLKYLQDDRSKPERQVIVEALEAWNTFIASNAVPKAITSSISNALMGFDVKEIGRIIAGFPNSAELHLAKFRNGDWLSGVEFFTFIKYFYPEAPTYWWNTILSHVKSMYLNQTIDGLRSFLPDRFTPDGITHAYTLAGFLKEPQLVQALSVSWKKYAHPKLYPAWLWAILNCFTNNDRQIVTDALSYWSKVSKEDRSISVKEESASRSIENQLKFLNWKFSVDQLTLLIDLCGNIALREILALLFGKIDHPIAFGAVLDVEMQRSESEYRYDDWDERWDRSKTSHWLNDASLDYLLQVFSDSAGHPIRRYVAWRYWTGNVDPAVALKKLQEMTDEQDSLFDDAVIWRVKQQDQSTVSAMKIIIGRKPWLVRVLADIWNEEVKMFFTDWFDKRIHERDKDAVKYGLELLALLDNADACALLINKWEEIRLHPKAIETALFLSAPSTISLADQEIKKLGFVPGQLPPPFYCRNMTGLYISEGDGMSEEEKQKWLSLAEQFKYMYMHYGAKYKGREERLTRKKLETLVPYLSLFDSMSIYEFALDSLRIGAPDLCYEYFFPLMGDSYRARIRLTTEDVKYDLIGKYKELERDNKVHIDHWIEGLAKLGVTNEMLAEALQSFSEQYQNENAFFIIATILGEVGIRKNIPMMESFISGPQEKTKDLGYWKANAIFLIKRRSLI